MKNSVIQADVDFEKDGIQHGFLKLPHSDEKAAWGAIMIPVTVVKNGKGPTALLTGANHGDEYEGTTALVKLANTMSAEQVRGRIIMVPMMNTPAFLAGRRNSPIDEGNMNRLFPGRPDGGATEKIADYFNRVLLPLSDFVLDMHSGGKTLMFVPFAAAHILDDKQQQARCEAAMSAFDAPYSVMLLEQDADAMYDTAAENQGKVFVSTELGGGGTTSPQTNEIAWRGVLGFLSHAGIITDDLAMDGKLSASDTNRQSIRIAMPDADCHVTCKTSGLLEMLVSPGDAVDQNQVVAVVHPVERTGEDGVQYLASRAGILIGRHHPGLIRIGDTIAVIGVAV